MIPAPKRLVPRGRHILAGTLAILFMIDCVAWSSLFFGDPRTGPRAYFLDVGQGDSEAMVFPDGAIVMTDAGPTDAVLAALDHALPGTHYIDLAIITHPQLDHFNGYNFILDHYDVGAFIYNGRDDPGVAEWAALKNKIAAKHISFITLGAGDHIREGEGEIDILSPGSDFLRSAELNDTGIVEMVRVPQFRALFTADIGSAVEDWLVRSGSDLHADVLKIAHHGSKYSSGAVFLRAVQPAVAVIEVGAKNTYGQPGAATLARVASSTHAEIFRTDQNGTVEIFRQDDVFKIEWQK